MWRLKRQTTNSDSHEDFQLFPRPGLGGVYHIQETIAPLYVSQEGKPQAVIAVGPFYQSRDVRNCMESWTGEDRLVVSK